jgi:hypothetical protein
MKTYIYLEQRVKVLEDLLYRAQCDQTATKEWINETKAALTPEKSEDVNPDTKCACKHTFHEHALSGLCCGEGCECMKFTRRK